MNRICVETRGICNWRERLAKPDSQWRRGFSAFETAVSWEKASSTAAGLPESIAELFRGSAFGEATLLLAVAEHKVPLIGGLADSQCDVWAVLNTASGGLSLSVEAKANEPFGEGSESLEHWLAAGGSARSEKNRSARWKYIAENLPPLGCDAYNKVPYQLLHRCAAEPGSLVVRIDLDNRTELLAADPDVYYVTDHYLNDTCVLVRLSRVTPDVLRDLLGMAHKFVTADARRSPSRNRRKPV